MSRELRRAAVSQCRANKDEANQREQESQPDIPSLYDVCVDLIGQREFEGLTEEV